MPQAPTPPIKDIVITSEDPELVEILKEIKQLLDIREGRLGDTGFRFIDYYELVELLAGDETITVTVLPAAHNHPHNDLTGLQGSGPEYSHLSAAEYGLLHAPDIITEGNSSVEVIDSGTGQVDVTVDATLVLRALVDRLQFPIGLLETNTGTPIDLTIDCGAQKTAKLEQGVWKDINLGAAQLSTPASSAPDQDTFDDEGGTDTDITTYAFDVGEHVSGSFEIQHDYKYGTDVSFHVHWQGKAAPSGTDNVRWQLTYTITRDGATLDPVTVLLTPDTPIDTQYDFLRSTFASISGSTGGNNGGPIQLGDQFLFQLERVAAVGDAYAGDALIATMGLHYQVDTLGSRQIGVK